MLSLLRRRHRRSGRDPFVILDRAVARSDPEWRGGEAKRAMELPAAAPR
jgi:hypothetical protein